MATVTLSPQPYPSPCRGARGVEFPRAAPERVSGGEGCRSHATTTHSDVVSLITVVVNTLF